MKDFLSTISLILQGYTERDREFIEDRAKAWEALHEQHMLRNNQAQASLCKKEAEKCRRMARLIV